MIDLVGRSQGAFDRARVIGDYWGEADARRQQRWVNRELRDERERDHQWNRDASIARDKQLERSAGLFTDYSEELGSYRPGNGDLESSDRLNAGYASAGATAGVGAGTAPGGAAGQAPGAPSATSRGGPLTPSNRPTFDEQTATGPVPLYDLNDEERAAVEAYVAASGGRDRPRRPGDAAAIEAARQRMLALGLDMRQNHQNRRQQIVRVRRGYSLEALRSPWAPQAPADAGVPIPDGGAQSGIDQLLNQDGGVPDVDFGDPGPDPGLPQAPGGMEPQSADGDVNRENYFGINDASRSMQPTREMRLIAAQVQDNFEQARLAAQRGRREESQVAYAAALQGQAGYLGLMRRAQYQAFAAGNWAAGADLMAQFAGYGPGEMQIVRAPGTPDRFVTQVLTENGWETISEESYTYQDYANGLLSLVDAERAAARSEANMEMVRAQIEAGADVTVARINSAASLNDNITALLQTRLTIEARNAWESGRAEIHQNNETGDAYMVYDEYNPQTRRYDRIAINLTEEDVRVSGVDGNETERRVVGRRITGIQGATPYVPGPGGR